MSFRKNQLTFEEGQFGLIMMGISSLLLGSKFGWGLMLIGIIAVVMFVTSFLDTKEIITINEAGIFFQSRDELVWSLRWEEIAYLERGHRFHRPAMEIILKDEGKKLVDNGKLLSYYFQLGDEAIDALKLYWC